VPKKLYWYFCAKCPKIQVKRTKQGGAYCGECSKKQPRRKNRLPIYYDLKEMKMVAPMRHIRICPHCPSDSNTKTVQVARLAGIRPCRKHAYIDNPEALAKKEAKRQATRKANKPLHRKVYKKKDKTVSKEAIEKQIVINRKHKEEVKAKEKKIVSKKTDKQMMAEFLKKNDVKVLGDTTPIDKVHYFNGNGLSA